MRDVFICDAVRTPIGRYAGSLAKVRTALDRPLVLPNGSHAIRQMIDQAAETAGYELDIYCDRVASAVGRLSIKVFGMDEGAGFELAHHLGRALQLTNILRDIDEDAAIGRLYLPREYLEEMDCCRQMDPKTIIGKPAIDGVCLAHHH